MHRKVLLAGIFIAFLPPQVARGQAIPRTDAELARAADAIVIGRVRAVAGGEDPAVGYFYTYVTVELSEVVKGSFIEPVVVLKQLGGRVGDVEMVVYDQPRFQLGEEVLLFLSRRPRDGTLRTLGLWQGKWVIRREGAGDPGVAMRSPFADSDPADPMASHPLSEFRLLGPFRAELREWVRERERSAERPLSGRPVEVPAVANAIGEATTAGAFTLLGDGARWHQADAAIAVPVDVQATGQPGLPGGGFALMDEARDLWNAAGSSLRLRAGTNQRALGFSDSQVCADTRDIDGRLSVYFDDPCDEIGNQGVLAIGGFYSSWSDTRNIDGVAFRQITKGFVITSDSASVSTWLTSPGCFLDIQVHELGHAVGLGHSTAPGDIMYPTIDNGCLSSASTSAPLTTTLGSGDVEGVRYIYPVTSTLTPPAEIRINALSGGGIRLRWVDTTGVELGFRVFRRLAGARFNLIEVTAPDTQSYVDTGVTQGYEYCYRVQAVGATGHSAFSDIVCAHAAGRPAAPTGLTATVGSGGAVTLEWEDNSHDESSFRVFRRLAGAKFNYIKRTGADITSYIDTGLGSTHQYCYRVAALNSSGRSGFSNIACVIIP